MPNKAQKIPKTASRVSLTMKIDFNKGQGKSSKPRASKKVFFFSSTRYFRRPSTFLLPSASTNFTCLHWKVVPHRNICSSCLSAEYCLGVPKVNPNKKPRKNFFVINDHEQYGEEFCLIVI